MRILYALALVATPAAALDMNGMKLANAMGAVLASEEPCSLSYDPAAIEAFIAELVDPADLDFAPQLAIQTRGVGHQIERMTPNQLVAHCATVRRSAEAFGFIGRT
jgi:hypothetical protein